MFNWFRKKVTSLLEPTQHVRTFETVEVVVEDVTIVMRFADGIRRKEFKAITTYCPIIATRERGVFVSDANDIAKNFLSWFAKDGIAVINDEVLRFDNFLSATLERAERTVTIRVPTA